MQSNAKNNKKGPQPVYKPYLRGPQLRALVHGNIRQNKRKHNAKERKAREQRAKQMEQKNKKKELI